MSDSNMIMLESKTSEAFKSNQDFDKHPNRRSFVTLTSLPRPQRSIPNGFPASEPAVIEKAPLRFLITDSPSNQNIESHLRNLQKYKVKHVCKAANTTYSTLPLEQHGIQVHNLVFPDGDAPPPEILTKWLKLVQECFMKPSHPEKGKKLRLRRFLTKSNSLPEDSDNASKVSDLEEGERISVHCVAGLGRGPVLVAVALIEFGGLDPKEAVAYIRAHRRGAINKKQYEWLEAYQPKYRTSKKILCPVS